jgi:hypothetical protein
MDPHEAGPSVVAPTLLKGNEPVPATAVADEQAFEPWAEAVDASRTGVRTEAIAATRVRWGVGVMKDPLERDGEAEE